MKIVAETLKQETEEQKETRVKSEEILRKMNDPLKINHETVEFFKQNKQEIIEKSSNELINPTYQCAKKGIKQIIKELKENKKKNRRNNKKM